MVGGAGPARIRAAALRVLPDLALAGPGDLQPLRLLRLGLGSSRPATATIASWIVTHHAFLPGFEAPYVVLTVRLAEQDDLLLPGGYDGPADDAGLRDRSAGDGGVRRRATRRPGPDAAALASARMTRRSAR